MTGKSEKAILNDTLVDLSALPETFVYRNNTGMGWQGDEFKARIGSIVKVTSGMTILMNARPIRFGLPGSGDIMGASRGRPLAVEVKDVDGRQEAAQINFERAWVKAGGLYVLARSREEAVAKVR